MVAGAPTRAGGKRRQRRYTAARDLVPPKFEAPAAESTGPLTTVSLARTDSGHIAGSGQTGSGFRSERGSRSEVRPSGNSVNLEQEMMKVAANQMDYQSVAALYTRSLSLIKTALGKG